MNYYNAIATAQERASNLYGCDVCLHSTIVKTYGWIFDFESLEYMETGDSKRGIGDGKGFFVILKSGDVWYIPSRIKVRQFVEEWESFSSGGQSELIDRIIDMHKR